MSAIKLLEEILVLASHDIPFHAYGDNQAACELSHRLEKIRISIDALLKTGGWLPVTERLPGMHETVRVTDGLAIWPSKIASSGIWADYAPGCGEPSKWQSLPPLPEDKNDNR